MSKDSLRRLSIVATMMMFALTGCLRQASSDSADANFTSQPLDAPTSQVSPVVITQAVEVTRDVIVTATPDPEQTAQVAMVVTATIDPFAPTQTPAVVTATPDPLLVPTLTPEGAIGFVTPTPDPFALPTQTPESLILVTPTPDPLLAPTLTPQGAILVTPTPDPASEVFPAQQFPTSEANEIPLDVPAANQEQEVPTQDPFSLDPNALTATAIIQAATDQALFQTQTAVGPTVAPVTLTPTQDPFIIATLTPTPGNVGPIISGSDCVHQVRAGENLFRLSLLYGVSINDIAVASGISNPNLIAINQRLTIPGCGTTGAVPPPTTPPDLESGSGGTVGGGTGSGGGVVHVVQQYETLFQLSLQYNVPVASIAAANGVSNINLIYIGQELVIP